MTLLGIDIGTTHCKAGLFSTDGTTLKVAVRPTASQIVHDGVEYAAYRPDQIWHAVSETIRQVSAAMPGRPIRAIGIASMAESGLLIDRATGQPRSHILPWFDSSPQPQVDAIAASETPLDFYLRTGLRISHKLSLAKILWLRDRDPAITDGAVWLSVADFIAYKLTGALGTDYSLAGRTGAFDIARRQWDSAWLARWGLSPEHFAPAHASGVPVGGALPEWAELGISAGTPVAVCGHDHLCAASLAGPDDVFDSMGTAEVIVGSFPSRPLTREDFDSGLLSGCHVIPDRNYWLGSLSASGGSIEWLRGLLSSTTLSYDEVDLLAASAPASPSGILYFPYLAGSGAPHSAPTATGAFIGLRSNHTRADLAKAVLEGTAFEMEYIRRAGERMNNGEISCLTVAGGGARSRIWLQIKADISGCEIRVPAESEMTLLGAALAAASGIGIATSPEYRQSFVSIRSNARHNAHYRDLFEQYLELQAPLRRFRAYLGDHSHQ